MQYRVPTGIGRPGSASSRAQGAVVRKGQPLVSTEQTDGNIFAQTVILLLYYDDTGMAGLVVNRPTDVKAGELVPEDSPISAYAGVI